MHDDYKDWIKEYHRTFTAKKKAVDFVNLLFIKYDFGVNEHIKYGYKIAHIKDKRIFNLLPDVLKQHIDESSVDSSEEHLIFLLKDNQFYIEYLIVPKNRLY